MTDPLASGNDPLAEPMQLAMDYPPGKTPPSRFLQWDPAPHAFGGAPAPAPLIRKPLVRARDAESGRAKQTQKMRMDRDQAILEAGAENLAQGPTAAEWAKLSKHIARESFEGDPLDTEFKAVMNAVQAGMPFRRAMLQFGSQSLLEGFETLLKRDRSDLGLGWPEELPWANPD